MNRRAPIIPKKPAPFAQPASVPEPEASGPITRRVALCEFNALPIGLPSERGGRSRGIAFKRWMFDDEIALGQIAAKNEDQSQPRYYMEILAHFLTHIGDQDLTDAKPAEKVAFLARLYAADFLTAWCLLRVHAMGKKVPLQLKCPHCKGEAFRWDADISTLPIILAEEHHPLRREVALQDGFDARGKTFRSLIIAPFRWTAYDLMATQRNNINALRASIVRSAIVGLPGVEHEIVLSEAELRKGMTKADFEILFTEAHKDHIGPDFKIQPECPHCHEEFEHFVPWEYGSFFSSPGSSP